MITYTLYTPPPPAHRPVDESIKQAVDKVVRGGLSLIEGPSTPLQLPGEKAGGVITLEQKQTALEIVRRMIAHKKLDRPQFVARYGKPVKELLFEDLLFITGMITDIGEMHFTRAPHSSTFIVPYNVRVIHVGQYINSKRNSTPMGRVIIDPYAVGFQLPREEVSRRYSTHPCFDTVMEAFGNDAEF